MYFRGILTNLIKVWLLLKPGMHILGEKIKKIITFSKFYFEEKILKVKLKRIQISLS